MISSSFFRGVSLICFLVSQLNALNTTIDLKLEEDYYKFPVNFLTDDLVCDMSKYSIKPCVLGEGGCGTVNDAVRLSDGKSLIFKSGRRGAAVVQVETMMNEVRILKMIKSEDREGYTSFFPQLECVTLGTSKSDTGFVYRTVTGIMMTRLPGNVPAWPSGYLRLDCIKDKKAWIRNFAARSILAIEQLNAYGIVHMDFKFLNTLDNFGQYSLFDFGASVTVNDTVTRGVITPKMFSPEQVSLGLPWTYSDYFSFGVALYNAELFRIADSGPGNELDLYRSDGLALFKFKTLKTPASPKFDPELFSLIRDYLLIFDWQERGAALKNGSIKNHPYFAGFDWEAAAKNQVVFENYCPIRDKERNTTTILILLFVSLLFAGLVALYYYRRFRARREASKTASCSVTVTEVQV